MQGTGRADFSSGVWKSLRGKVHMIADALFPFIGLPVAVVLLAFGYGSARELLVSYGLLSDKSLDDLSPPYALLLLLSSRTRQGVRLPRRQLWSRTLFSILGSVLVGWEWVRVFFAS